MDFPLIPDRIAVNAAKALDNLIPKKSKDLYDKEYERIIEHGRDYLKKSCTEILIDEWGTSGRTRATLGHLKYLLTKAELFRAADYVAKLLNEEPPPRPTSGPAAYVPLSLSEITHNTERNPNIQEIERRLDEINYQNNAIAKITNTYHEMESVSNIIPKIVVSEVDKAANKIAHLPLVIQESFENSPEESDMIIFSKSLNNVQPHVPAEVPELSLFQDSVQNSNPEVPDLQNNSSAQGCTPAFSQILSDKYYQPSDPPIPLLSLLGDNQQMNCDSGTDFLPNLTAFNDRLEESTSCLIPNFEMLQSRSSQNSNFSNSVLTKSDSTDSSALSCSNKCPSPLPNLSLNTQLPHFRYTQLEAATNNFSERPFTSEKENGRFLGSGAFGSVFLALGLLNEPVAVKKIFLQNVEIVNEDDEVTKQFKNEVELLSKYKHENLVSLIGYSCDGCTYCLVYEYVPGGALFDILEKNPQKLSWRQRIQIALGTAKAVAYLHTAFSSPLIHRDIKSANILLDASHNPKLCDFGIVKLLPNQKTDMQTTLYGTSAYMSPEYHRGDVSIKLDTFSFGVVLLELLTSLPPIDYNRQGADLVTYVEENCEDSIELLLDKTVGTWEENGNNFATELYNLTLECLDDKKKRPIMVDVVNSLEKIVQNICV